jgi:hypothetical protein
VVDRAFEPRSDQTKDYKIRVCYFSAKHAALMRKSKDWLVRNQDNVSEWGDMSMHGSVNRTSFLSSTYLDNKSIRTIILFNANSAIFQLSYRENKLSFNKEMTRSNTMPFWKTFEIRCPQRHQLGNKMSN